MAYFERRKKLTISQLAKDTGISWAKVNWRVTKGEIPPPTEPVFFGKLAKQYRPEVYDLAKQYLLKLQEQGVLKNQTVQEMLPDFTPL